MDVSKYVLYLERYEVMVCRICRYCITPGWASKHFGRWHKGLDIRVRRKIAQHCDTLVLCGPKDVAAPTDGKPVEELSIRLGKRCLMDGCKIFVQRNQQLKHTDVVMVG